MAAPPPNHFNPLLVVSPVSLPSRPTLRRPRSPTQMILFFRLSASSAANRRTTSWCAGLAFFTCSVTFPARHETSGTKYTRSHGMLALSPSLSLFFFPSLSFLKETDPRRTEKSNTGWSGFLWPFSWRCAPRLNDLEPSKHFLSGCEWDVEKERKPERGSNSLWVEFCIRWFVNSHRVTTD